MLGDLLQKKKRYGAQCNSATMYDKEICRSVTRLYHRRTIRSSSRGIPANFSILFTGQRLLRLLNYPSKISLLITCPVLCFPTAALNIVLVSMRKSKIGRKMQILRNCMELPSIFVLMFHLRFSTYTCTYKHVIKQFEYVYGNSHNHIYF